MGYRGLPGVSGGQIFAKFKVKVVDEIPKLIADIQKANRRNVYKASLLIRTIARRSIRKSKKASEPGQPPKYHGHPKQGLRMIWAEIERPDSMNPSAIVGPVKFDAVGEDVPHVLEFGGIAVNKRGQKYKLAARPYMRPAEQIARGKYPQFWQDSV